MVAHLHLSLNAMTRSAVLLAALAGVVPAAAATLNELFDDSVLHEVRLSVHPSDWQRLRENYRDDTYYQAAFEWRGQVLENIGIRSRGSGSRSGEKPGLKVDFGKYASSQTFLGLKSLVLDNLTQDQTMLGERLSLQLFRKMGLAAPRLVHVRLMVNDAYFGLYTMVEPVDKGFLERNLGEDSGYLYDYEWVSKYAFEYLGEDPAFYSPYPFQPQTNEKNPNPTPLVEMIRAVNESSDADFAVVVSQYLDPAQFLDYLATEAFISEMDGILGEEGINNFYLYRRQGQNLNVFIPWDKDVTFRDVNRSIWQNSERNVLVRRMLNAPEFREHYLRAIARCGELAGGAGGWLEQEVENGYQQVREAVSDDPNKPFTYGQFEEGIAILRNFAFARLGVVTNQLAESVAVPAEPVPQP